MKKLFRLTSLALLFGAGCLFGLSGCSDDNDPIEELVFELDATGTDGETPVLLLSEETFAIPYHADGATSIEATTTTGGWLVDVDEVNSQIVVTAPEADAEASKTFTLQLTALGAANQSITTESIDFYHLTFDDPEGAFVLNEGNMTTENGSLIYITPEGYIVDDAYKLVNGTEMGNVTQDMCFHDGKIYIISQNGDTNPLGTSFDNDGMLMVVDAKTLKKEKCFTKAELSQLNWPTHIAVLDEQHVYIRDKAGVWRLDTTDGSLHSITLYSDYEAPQAPFVVLNGKVYTYYYGGYMVGLFEISPERDMAERVAPWNSFGLCISLSGIAATDDGQLYILGSNNQSSHVIYKYDVVNQTETANYPISLLPALDWNHSGCLFAAHGDLIYYLNGTTLYRMDFETGTEETLVDLSTLDDDARESYNGVAVNPVNGRVYVNTIRGVGNFYTTNQIWVFDPANFSEPLFKYDNYTHFPAGTFFNN